MVQVIASVLIGVGAIYFVLMAAFCVGFKRLQKVKINGSQKIKFSVSIILPFCNEQHSISQTIESILAQTGVDFELIAVDNASTDNSREIVDNFAQTDSRVHVVSCATKGKKYALLAGIAAAQHDAIVTIDADCLYGETWLKNMAASYLQLNAVLLAAPVCVASSSTFFGTFQAVEFRALVRCGIGAAGVGFPIMCNGCNLMYSKSVFSKLTDPLRIAQPSGDDVFLLHSMKRKYPTGIKFVCSRETIAHTTPVTTIKQFLQQRARWASKAPAYSDAATIVTALVVAAEQIALLGSLVLALMQCWQPLLVVGLSKLLIDSAIIFAAPNRFGKKTLMLMPVFEIMLSAYMLALVLGVGKSKQWR